MMIPIDRFVEMEAVRAVILMTSAEPSQTVVLKLYVILDRINPRGASPVYPTLRPNAVTKSVVQPLNVRPATILRTAITAETTSLMTGSFATIPAVQSAALRPRLEVMDAPQPCLFVREIRQAVELA